MSRDDGRRALSVRPVPNVGEGASDGGAAGVVLAGPIPSRGVRRVCSGAGFNAGGSESALIFVQINEGLSSSDGQKVSEIVNSL